MKTKSTFYLTPFKHFTFGKDKQALVCSRLIGVVIAALVLLTASVNVQAQRKYHVSTSGNNLHSGLTWKNAFATLEKAISVATSNSDTIFVQEGTYYQSAAYTLITNDIKIFGSFNGTETRLEQRIFSNKNLTILDAQNKSCVINLSGRSSATVIDGFMITNGKHDDNYGGGGMDLYNSSPALRNLIIINNSAVHGGGITNFYSSPKLTNVIIEGNTANFFGGGMYNNSSSPTLTDVTFDRNTANNSGGGMYNLNSAPTLSDVTIRRNIIYINGDGGGMYNNNSAPTLTNVTISENTATDNCAGGGMFNNNSSPMLTNVTISGNRGSGGGGMFNMKSSSPTLINVTISGNTARSGGGMTNELSSPKLINVTINGNVVTTAGGGMSNFTSSPTLTNVTISGNTAGFGGGMENRFNSRPQLYNSIVLGNNIANNISDDIVNYSVNDIPKYDFCLVGGKGYGYHNGSSWDNKLYNAKDIFVDYHPSFVGTPTTLGDYSLLSKSFAIDKGYNKYNNIPTDLAGNPRIVNGTIDLGAYEYQRAFSKSATLGAQSGSLTTKESSIFTATPTGIANISANELKVYPNPFIDEVHITGTYGKTTLRIFNSNGAVVHTRRITSPNETLSLGSLPSGMYFFRLENDGKAITVKAIKLR